MGDLTTEYKIKLGKILALIGSVLTIFIPFFGIMFLGLGMSITRKQDNLEMKHVFMVNIIGLIAAITLTITSIILVFIG